MLSQKESVFQAVETVLNENQKSIIDGTPVELTSDERRTVIGIITQSVMQGETEMKQPARERHADEKALTGYVSSLVSNWLRKDKRLNGGQDTPPAKNPGSRRGSSDPILKNLRNFLQNVKGNTEAEAAVNEEINKRMAELASKKVSSVVINPDDLPEHLRQYVVNPA